MTSGAVTAALVRWLAQSTGLPTIQSHQSGARPADRYLRVNLTGVRELHRSPQNIEYAETEALNASGERIVEAAPVLDMEWTFSIHSYGADPVAPLVSVKSQTRLSQRLEPMHPALTINNTGPVNSVPEFINARWDPRAVMRITVVGLVRGAFAVDTVDEATVAVTRKSLT